MHKTPQPFDKLQLSQKYFAVYFCMRSIAKTILVSGILLYTSCAEETSTAIPTMDSDSLKTVTIDSVPAVDSLSATTSTTKDTIATVLLDWEKELQAKGIKMSLDKFYAAGMSDLILDSGYAWDGIITDQFTPSPDGRYYSRYEPSWGDGDADTYVFLYDTKTWRMYYLNVIGTCCTYMGTGWANNHTLVAIGYNTDEAEDRYPNQNLTQGFYHLFDLNAHRMMYYESRNFFRRPCDGCGPSTIVN